METLCFESAGALARSAAEAGGGRWGQERLRRYARWSLQGARPPSEPGTAAALAVRLLLRGILVPASPFLEAEALRFFGGRAPAALRFLHRLQLAAFLSGESLPCSLENDLGRLGLFDVEEARLLSALAIQEARLCLRRLEALYPPTTGSGDEGEPLFVSFGGWAPGRGRSVFIAEGWTQGTNPWLPRAPFQACVRPRGEDLAYFLETAFRLNSFRPGQAEAVAALLEGGDVGVLMPTGAGKSLIYQLAALLCPGTALVIEPLLALIDDQARHLRRLGLTSFGVLTGQDRETTRRDLRRLAQGSLIMCYAAAERLEVDRFRQAARDAAESGGFSFIAVDEAHCAAQWGHDFRPAYRSFGARARFWCQSPGRLPAVAALTGTASPAALREACRLLGMAGERLLSRPADLLKLEFRVEKNPVGGALARLRRLLCHERPGGRFSRGLVFCPHVDGEKGALGVSEELLWGENLEAGCFTGRAPSGWSEEAWSREKNRQVESFLEGRLALLCCTSAFGMGIDSPGIRWTVHFGLPLSVDNFFQEAGRAGRDGAAAVCWLIMEVRSLRRAREWLKPAFGAQELERRLAVLAKDEEDDVSRALRLHLRSYPGYSAEKDNIRHVLRGLGGLDKPARRAWRVQSQSLAPARRAFERLSAAGVLEVVDCRPGCVIVDLAGGFTPQTALEAARIRLDEIYDAIEPKRRIGLAELLELCLEPDPGAALSRRLRAYYVEWDGPGGK